ncbi:MAG TPA: hypothetical protein VH639_26505 [Bryobacteraceae bacterium]|jgi:hypothetical protein
MDLKVYYRKIREIEAGIAEPFVVVVSKATEEGGKAGVKSEVPRRIAAKMIAEETAGLATPEEAAEFRAGVEKQWKAALPEKTRR